METNVVTKRSCRHKQDGCTVDVDNKCLESLDPDSCPHHFYLDVEEHEESEIEDLADTLTYIEIFEGKALRASETSSITERFECEKIFIVGESGSGKTTLLATIFDLFQISPINDILFAGSLTQPGFEERCHRSRTTSKAVVADTEKTSTKEFNFLHLAVKKRNLINQPPVNFLISDISGERLQLARDSSSAILELDILKSASSVIYIIDGEKLSQLIERRAILFNAKTFIQKALDENIFDKKTELRIVISKWDLLLKDTSFDFSKEIIEPMNMQFKDRLKALSYSRIAARPLEPNDQMDFGFGVYELLNSWVEMHLRVSTESLFNGEEEIKSDRLIDHFKVNL